MLPIVDYGSIAIVIPRVTAIGNVTEDKGKFVFEVYLSGMNEPIVIGFDDTKEAAEAREDLVAVVAQYHYISILGPDFDIEEFAEGFEEEDDEDKH